MKTSWKTPEIIDLVGEQVLLRACDPFEHCKILFEGSHGSPEKLAVWKYLFYGPFTSAEDMIGWYATHMTGKTDPLVWAVLSKSSSLPVGVTALLSISSIHARAEIGHVWFTPAAHRTGINTESQYLLLKYLFDDLKYRRVEWKCDSFNQASRMAATRMGFIFEGRFRQHMVVRGKSRDTDWFAMTDKDWPLRKRNFEKWLYSGENLSLMELNNA